MKTPDATEIKNEINEISSRIDNIVKTVKQYFPVTEADRQTDGETEPEQAESTCNHQQKPEQEA
ncbi:MAG: hypothetical protein KGY38_03495 [Desulfobacterales bacterium]|nr:hypothetical protein [Desulfobacterales bacterium]